MGKAIFLRKKTHGHSSRSFNASKCLLPNLAKKAGRANFGNKILFLQGSFPLGNMPYNC